ncbi:MAG: transcription-repair coupling factor [Deltaproteobacteria bacterium]|nr:transcription-repair coupling factor [Deltaproteobacteria bacterium]
MSEDRLRDKENFCGIEELLHLTTRAWEKGEGLAIAGLEGGGKGFFINLLGREISPLLVITPDRNRAEALFEAILFFTPPEEREGILLFPSDGIPYGDIPSLGLIAQRMKALRFLAESKASVVIAPIQGIQGMVIPQQVLIESLIRIEVGHERDREALVQDCIALGYSRVEMVEERGEMSLRGGIMDIYPLDQDRPLRLEFFGDQVASLRTFDEETQRSTEQVREAVITPMGGEEKGVFFEYLPAQTPVLLDTPLEVEHEAQEFWEGLRRGGGEDRYLSPDTVMAMIRERPLAEMGGWVLTTQSPPRAALRASSNEGLSREIRASGLKALSQAVQGWLHEKWAVYITAQTPGQGKRLVELLEDFGLKKVGMQGTFPPHPLKSRGRLVIVVGDLRVGFCLPIEGIAVVTEEEIFGLKQRVGHGRRAQPTPFTPYEDLRGGDHVVHVDYGIGLYRGLVRLEGEGVENDYLFIEYEGGDKLYVPVDRFNLVHKYIGTGEGTPQLDRLGGQAWQKTKKRVKRAVEEAARELLEIYAARKAFQGFAFSPRDIYVKEFEAGFQYEETPDQGEAIERVMEDMEAPRPADRLVCGDVGYGKTEVAIRAAFKAALDNKQTAVLVPTTVLAQQHLATFTARLRGYPMVVESLSRFKSRAEQGVILQRLKEGTIDIIIATHRLLRPDVSFRDLGLLIIDEEHRFGVSHKERLKEMKKLVDCITLTATPIPRTLQMSLVGIRDLSLITTPPPNRQSIRTHLITFDQEVIKEAILREIDRGGQIFFVHNRVRDIDAMASLVQGLAPGVRLAIAHGQMRERALEGVMMQFVRNEVDLLVCTSIIESGLDIPNANTIIINHAERFGLADLYQLRGRVGRSAERAYAYLIVPPRQHLSREAFKRLRAIQELSELGSGFRLAMRDLEIRGAGNLLGHVQSGHIAEVGFELYNSLLEKAMRELKGEEVQERVTPEIHIPIEAFIPAEYITNDNQRLLFYKRLSALQDEEEIEEITGELRDRFGPPPAPLLNLLEVIKLKIWLSQFSVQRFEFRDNRVVLTFVPDGAISPEKVINLIQQGGGTYQLTPDMRLLYTPAAGEWRGVLDETRNILQGLV